MVIELLKSELKKMDIEADYLENLQRKDGIYVYRIKIDDKTAIMKYFEKEEYKREILCYRKLKNDNIDTIPILYQTDNCIIMEDMNSNDKFRLGIKEDLSDVKVIKAIAKWYKQLHSIKLTENEINIFYSEAKLLTKENLEKIQKYDPDNECFKFFKLHEKELLNQYKDYPVCLNYNDFYYTNLVVSKDKSSAFMFDYNLLGVWVIVPAKVISLTVEGDSSLMIQYVILGGLLSILCAMGTSFLRGNYRMRMNNVRYHLIRDLIEYSLTMPYENTLDPKQLTKIALADISVKGPMQGAGGIILMILSLFGNLFASIGFLSLMSTLSFWIMLVLFILVLGSFYFSSKAASFDESTWNQWGEYERRYFQTTNIMTDPSYGKNIRLYSLIEILESYCNKLINQFKIIAKSVN